MNKTVFTALSGLLASRKNLVAVFAILTSGVVVLYGMVKGMPHDVVIAMAGVPAALGWKLIGAIAQEDSAGKTADAHVTAAQAGATALVKAASMRPPPGPAQPPQSIPAAAAIPVIEEETQP